MSNHVILLFYTGMEVPCTAVGLSGDKKYDIRKVSGAVGR